MRIRDRLYGTFEITEPVLLTLLHTKALKRLRGIAQYGIPNQYYHKTNYSRFEHSLGVMLLLKYLNGTVEEQVAGLLHDVSHTAFSHVVDWVLGSGKTENFQDDQYEVFINQSELPEILTTFGFNSTRILNHKNFGLLERDLPELCADRVDYAFREMPPELVPDLIKGLTVIKGKIVFRDKNRALVFAQNFLRLQTEHWGGFEAASRYRWFADCLRRAMECGQITLTDFWRDDAFVLKKIAKSAEITRQLHILKQKSLAALPKSKVVVYKKFRYVDPLFSGQNGLVRLSEADKNFKQAIASAREKNALGIAIPKWE